MRLSFPFVLVLSALLVMALLDVADGGRRKSSGGFGSWGKKKTSYGSNNYGSKSNWGSSGYKKKGGAMKTLKKAAVIGAVAYGGYQLGKLSGRFHSYGHGHGGGWGWNDYNRWREVDGFMCRNTNDCNWIDRNLYCQDYELDFQPSVRIKISP